MKTIFFTALLLPTFSYAYIPSTRMILQRTAENSGSGSYTVEQEVQFPNGADSVSLKETWQIDNDGNLKVTVNGMKDLKDQVRFQIVYSAGQRSILKGTQKDSSNIPSDFTERFFFARNMEQLGRLMIAMQLIPSSALQKKALPRKAEDIKHDPEPFVRLSRAAGVVNWAFGSPTSPGTVEAPAGVWIEQDQFVIRKVRFLSQAELTAEQYAGYPRGLQLPRQKSLRWNNNSVQIRLLSVNAKSSSTMSLETPWKTLGLENQPAKDMIMEFYTRFR